MSLRRAAAHRFVSRRLQLLSLEDRLTPAAVSWDGGAGTLNWTDQNNWSNNLLPTSADDVTISGASGTVLYGGAATTIKSLSLTNHLTLNNGSITVSNGLSVSPLYFLTTNGAGVTFSASGATSIDKSYLNALGGSSITLSSLTAYTGESGVEFLASGANSKISLPNLTNYTGFGASFGFSSIKATAGGAVSVPLLTSFTSGFTLVRADGAASSVSLPALTSALSTGFTTFEALNGGTIQCAAMTKLNNATLTVSAGGTLNSTQITQFDNGHLYATGAATLTMTNLTSFQAALGSEFKADGTGAKISLPSLTSYIGAPFNFNFSRINAYAGGSVTLSSLGAISTGFVAFTADGASSVISLPALTSALATTDYFGFSATNGGNVQIPLLTKMSRADLTVSNGGTLNSTQVTQFDKGSLYANGAATLTMTGLTSYQADLGSTFRASGVGASVSLPNLTSYIGAPFSFNYSRIRAEAGGSVSLAKLASMTTGFLSVEADGAGSVVSFPALTSVLGTSEYMAFTASNSGNVQIPVLSKISRVDLALSNGGTMNTSQITQFDKSGLFATGAATLTLAGLTSYQADTGNTFQANGVGAKVSLPNLTGYIGSPFGFSYSHVYAYNGGNVSLAKLATLTTGFTEVLADGSGSTVDLPALTSVNSTNYAVFTANNTGAIQFPLCTSINVADLTIGNGGTITTSQITQFDKSNLFANGAATLTLAGLTAYQSAIGNIFRANGAGAKVSLPNLSSYSGSTASYSYSYLSGNNGGLLSMPLVTNLNTGFTVVQSDGASGVVDLPALTNVLATGYVQVNVINNGSVQFPLCTKFSQCDLIIGSGGTITTSQITQFNQGSLYANTGGTLTLAALTSHQAGNGSVIQAAGAGATVSLPALTTYIPSTSSFAYSGFIANAAGQVSAPLIAGVSSGYFFMNADGVGSSVSLAGLKSVTAAATSVTLINGGKLTVGGPFSANNINVYASGGQLVSGDMTLGATSLLEAVALSKGLTSSGTVRPSGTNAGPLALGGSLAFTGTATLEEQINAVASFDSVSVVGGVTLGRSKLSTAVNYSPALGATFTIIDNDGGDAVNGRFQGLDRGNYAATAPNGLYMNIHYAAGDGNDVTLKAHPVGVQIDVGTLQRSMIRSLVVRFTDAVSLGANPFTLTTQVGGPVAGVTLNPVLAGDGKTATITFTGAPIIGGSLPDGKYTLTVNGGAITVIGSGLALDADANGAPGGSLPVDFHRLFGDSNGDEFTDNIDLIAFRIANGSSGFGGNYNFAFDYDGDGNNDLTDFVQFRARLGAVLT